MPRHHDQSARRDAIECARGANSFKTLAA